LRLSTLEYRTNGRVQHRLLCYLRYEPEGSASMRDGQRWRLATAVSIACALLVTACGEPDHDLAQTDADVRGELIVVRDTDDDDKGEPFVVAADGSEARAITDDEGFGGLAVSPDGRTVAAFQSNEQGQPVVLIDVATGNIQPVSAPKGAYYDIHWSPDGEAFAFVGFDHSRVPSGGSGSSPGILRDLVYVADAGGTNVQPLDGSDGAVTPIWSPDSDALAYVQSPGVWVANSDGSDARLVTTGLQSVFSPIWSPAGNQIAFTGYANEYPAVYLVNADGSGQVKLSPEGLFASDPAWSPDGAWVAFSVFDRGDVSLHLIRPDGSDHRVVAEVDRINRLAWSPDGGWIAFTSAYGGNDGPITSVHLNIVNPFEDDAEVHTLLEDLASWDSLAWRADVPSGS
jgi:Tol biopolymer transport system component